MRHVNYNNIAPVFLLSILFFLQPLLSLITVYFFTFRIKKYNFFVLFLFSALCSSYLGFINATKTPESDLVTYFLWFHQANHYDFVTFVSLINKEFVFLLFTYLIANISNGNESVFIFLITILSYLLLSFSIIRLGQATGLKSYAVATLIMGFLFFPPLFNVSGHLMRQFMAASFLIVFYSEYCISGKKRWWLLFFAVFSHYTSLLFIFFLIFIKKNKRLSSSISASIGVLTIVIVMPLIIMIANSIFSDFVLVRQLASATKDVYKTGINFGILPLVMVFILLVYSVKAIFMKNKIQGLDIQGVDSFFIIIIISTLMFFLFYFTPNFKEVSGRLYFYFYFLSVPVFTINLSISKNSKILSVIFVSMMLLFFFVSINYGVWTYITISEMMFFPIFTWY